jgi:hypothetical protein
LANISKKETVAHEKKVVKNNEWSKKKLRKMSKRNMSIQTVSNIQYVESDLGEKFVKKKYN